MTAEVSGDTIGSIVPVGCSLVFDCLDNDESRQVFGKYCQSRDVPLVWGAVGGFDASVGCNVMFADVMPRPGVKGLSSPERVGVSCWLLLVLADLVLSGVRSCYGLFWFEGVVVG